MKKVIFAGKCNGIGITHVVRDCDFVEPIGFYRNEYQIHYMVEGERFFYIGKKGYRMSKGSISFIDKEQIPFTNVIGGEFHNRVLIEIDEQWLRRAGEILETDLLNFFRNYHGVLLMNEENQRVIEEKFQKMEEALKKKRDLAAAEVKVYLFEILLMVMNGCGEKPSEYSIPEGKMFRYIKVREITSYIMEHYAKVDGLDDIARIFYMDKSYLSRIFKEVTNFTVNEFINCERIKHARELLIDEELSIGEISDMLGYERMSYFDRVFKKYVGVTPLQFRKANLN